MRLDHLLSREYKKDRMTLILSLGRIAGLFGKKYYIVLKVSKALSKWAQDESRYTVGV